MTSLLSHPIDPINDVKKIYWDQEGNLRYGRSDRNRDEEIISILQADSCDDEDLEKIWMIIPSRWVKQWLLFAYHKVCNAPGKIDMTSLCVKDITAPLGWRPKNNLKAPMYVPDDPRVEDTPGHYRRVSFEVWVMLHELYGMNGFAIAVKGAPFDDVSRWRLLSNSKILDESKLPDPILPEDYETHAMKRGEIKKSKKEVKVGKSVEKKKEEEKGFFAKFFGVFKK